MPETTVLGTCDDEKNPHELEADCSGWMPLTTPKTYSDGLRDAASIAMNYDGRQDLAPEQVKQGIHAAILAAIPAEEVKK